MEGEGGAEAVAAMLDAGVGDVGGGEMSAEGHGLR